MKQIKWVEKDILLGKIDDLVIFQILLNSEKQYVLYNELPVKENGIFIFYDKNKDKLIHRAELLYKTFYESIK